MQKKRWVFLDENLSEDDINSAAQRLSVSPVIIKLLYNRGITADSEITSFIQKALSSVHSPLLLPDIVQAVDRIIKAVENGEKIFIYGDYDVDGITSCTILYKYLLSHGADVSYYIPDRITEGYGLNIKAINKISKSGCKLLITVDCGITAVGETELAKAQGMDVIITDHHTCQDKIPAAVAVINPKLPDSTYPFEQLAGVGVAFKLILALSIKFKEDTKKVFYKYSPYAAIGTVADVVSLTDENRIIVHRGIQEISKKTNAGINALMDVAGIKELSSSSVAFGLAPRINAAGRMGSPDLAAELLMSESPASAKEIAQRLNEENQRRRVLEHKIFQEAESFLMEHKDMLSYPVLVIYGQDWHQGVVGIVASRLSEKFYKPVILISHENGIGHGSCRSIDGFNIFDALTYCRDLLDRFGGHAMAAGVSLKMTEIDKFVAKINEYGAKHITPDMTMPTINIDCTIHPGALTEANIHTLSLLEPFGEGNPMPVFAIQGATVGAAMPMGEEGVHLRLQLIKDGYTLSCVAFRMGELYSRLTAGTVIDIAFTPEINCYNNRHSVQLRITDIKL